MGSDELRGHGGGALHIELWHGELQELLDSTLVQRFVDEARGTRSAQGAGEIDRWSHR